MVRAIGNRRELGESASPIYTPEKATQTLPLVRRVVKDLLSLQKTIEQQRVQLAGIEHLSGSVDHIEDHDELNDVRASLSIDQTRWNECVNELKSLGIETEEPFTGHIDFPAMLGRRPIRLCWNPKDETVSHWHEVDEEEGDRRFIEQAMLPAIAT